MAQDMNFGKDDARMIAGVTGWRKGTDQDGKGKADIILLFRMMGTVPDASHKNGRYHQAVKEDGDARRFLSLFLSIE